MTAIALRRPRHAFPDIDFLEEEDFAYIGQGFYSGIVEITPEMAQLWLESRNPHNRRLTDKTFQAYARSMEEGSWILNGEPIIFDRDGQLDSGQHRLRGCSLANRAFQTVITIGAAPEAMATIDVGMSRSGGAVLGLSGNENSYVLAAMAGAVYKWERGLRVRVKVLPPDLKTTLQAHPRLPDFVDHVRGVRRHKGFPRGLYAAHCYLFNRVDAMLEADFHHRFSTGEELTKGDPVLALQDAVIRHRGGARLPEEHWQAYIRKVWGALREDREVQLLRWKSSEGMPEINGLPRKI